MEDIAGAVPPSDDEKTPVPDSPKPMAFTIDFGAGKSIDTQRHKTLVEKYQKRHRRGESLSKLDDSTTSAATTTTPTASKKHPLSAHLPRKANYQIEGEKSMNNARSPRDALSLPLKSVNSDRMTQSCTLPRIESPNIELRNVVTPDFDLISPFSPQEQTETCKRLSSPGEVFIPAADFDYDKSDTLSDTGTYTLEADNYSEEQKERMSIDKDFKIESVSVSRKTEEYVRSLSSSRILARNFQSESSDEVEELHVRSLSSSRILARNFQMENSDDVEELQKPQTLSLSQNNSMVQKSKNKLSPIVSPTQNFSLIQNTEKQNDESDKIFTKIMFPSPKSKCGIGSERTTDFGSVISVTSSGAFRSKNEKENKHARKLSLTKSEVHVEAYTNNVSKEETLIRPNLSANLVLVSENLPKTINSDGNYTDQEIETKVSVGKVVNLPPPVGGGKNSPSKIPSPIHTSRPRSRNSSHSLNVDLSDSSLDTESYLKPTQNLLNSLQQRLSLDGDNDSDSEAKYLNNDAYNLLKKPSHLRHNSLDMKISNKLEHFQNKGLIDQTYMNMLNPYSHGKMHKIQNSPNNSPIKRSSSFSTKNQMKPTNLPQKETNLINSPNFGRNGSIQRSSSTASVRPALLMRRSSINLDHKIDRSQFGDTESSSEEDLKQMKKKDITNTRYNRAFSLRRARLDMESAPAPRCPNTPEMRRKFQPSDPRAERAISVDRRPTKANDVTSRYLQNLSRGKHAAVMPAPLPVLKSDAKGSPKIGNTATKPTPKQQVFSRTDTGRLSMRTTKPPVTNSNKTVRREFPGKKQSGPRSNSSLSSKEVEFQNWKRRKSYDPMKAAAEGKRKAELARKQHQSPMTQSYHESNEECDSSPSHSSSVHRSQSFHGTAALEQFYSSEEDEDLTLSADEAFSPPTPSPCDMSPNRVNLRYAWKDHVALGN